MTVMFADMEAFTSMVVGIGAEEAYDIMDRVYEILIHKVHGSKGTVSLKAEPSRWKLLQGNDPATPC